MSVDTGIFEQPSPPSKASPNITPLRITLSLVVLIFISEMVAMTIIYLLDLPNFLIGSLLDGLIMIVLIIPVLYYLQLAPLSKQINERTRAEEASRANESLLRKVLELLPVGVWIIDKSGKIVHGNPASHSLWAGARYVGIEQYGEYKGWWVDTGKPIKGEEWAAARAINRGETNLNEEVEIECFDGTHKIILNSSTPISDDHGTIDGAIVVNQDITERKHAEQALKEREALFRTALENLPVGFWLIDKTGKLYYGNPAGQEIWAGARFVSMEGFGEYKGWWLSTGKPIEPEEWGGVRAIRNGETSVNEEIEIECFDGTHKILLNSAYPVRDEQGHILWAFVVNQDVTLLKQREQALIQTNELLERYFASISTHIAYMDRDFNFIRVNDTYASAGGHPPEYFIGKNHFELYPQSENEAIFHHVVDTGEPFSVLEKPFEYPEYPERGVTYWDWGLLPVKGVEGRVEGLVLSLVDVTERKRAEIQLERQNEELRQLSDAERKQRELAETFSVAAQALTLNTRPGACDPCPARSSAAHRPIRYHQRHPAGG